jgi:SGNH domain (fused to AT3 domains)
MSRSGRAALETAVTGRRTAARIVPALTVAVLALAACSASGGTAGGTVPAHAPASPSATARPGGTSSGSGAAAAPARAAARAAGQAPLLPIQHGGLRPGAAELAGDVPHLAHASFRPTVAQAPHDMPSGASCQIGQAATNPRYCVFGDTTNPTRTIALVGDSVAGAWQGALTKIARAHHWKLIMATHSRCPWTATMTVNLGHTAPYTACKTWGARVLQAMLTRFHPALVIVSDRPVLGTPRFRPGPAASSQIGRGMATYWRKLSAHGIAIAPLREAPEMGMDIPHCVAARAPGNCGVSRRSAVARTTPITVGARLTHHRLRLIDLTNLICGKQTCHPVVGNVLVYRDKHHLTNTYALTIAPYLERRLLRFPLFAA